MAVFIVPHRAPAQNTFFRVTPTLILLFKAIMAFARLYIPYTKSFWTHDVLWVWGVIAGSMDGEFDHEKGRVS